MEDTKIINILRLENIRATRAIELKQELEKDGLTLNVDFQWKWRSCQEDYTSSVEFTFKNPIHATFYKLRWE